MEPVADLKRAQPGVTRRRFGAHDENIGMEAGIGGEQVRLGLRPDPARPEKRLAARVKEKHQRAVLGAGFGTVGRGMEHLQPHAGREVEGLALLP